jgi:hypothetical protein
MEGGVGHRASILFKMAYGADLPHCWTEDRPGVQRFGFRKRESGADHTFYHQFREHPFDNQMTMRWHRASLWGDPIFCDRCERSFEWAA